MKRDTLIEQAQQRRLKLLTLLHQRPHCFKEIIAHLDQQQLFAYDREVDEEAIKRQQRYQFRRDLQALKLLGYKIAFNHGTKCYAWHDSPFVLSLDQCHLTALALLCDTFAHSTFPHSSDIRDFLSLLVKKLPSEQQELLLKQRGTIKVDLGEKTDYGATDHRMLQEIDIAIQNSLQLEFTYCSPASGKERRHVIEPRPLAFKDGHTYLYGRSIEGNRELWFRLDNIVPQSVHHLSIRATHNRPFKPSYILRYTLTATIARHSVSNHFEGQQVERHADSSATITAHTSDLFYARRILLSYGSNCIVHEPPELVAQMHEVRDHFNKTYPTPLR